MAFHSLRSRAKNFYRMSYLSSLCSLIVRACRIGHSRRYCQSPNIQTSAVRTDENHENLHGHREWGCNPTQGPWIPSPHPGASWTRDPRGGPPAPAHSEFSFPLLFRPSEELFLFFGSLGERSTPWYWSFDVWIINVETAKAYYVFPLF